jgi:hypothetical protein
MKDSCIILVFNKHHLDKAKETIRQIRNIGQYKDDIVCLAGNDIHCDTDYYREGNLVYKHFEEIERKFIYKEPITTDQRETRKTIQWHKMYCFHTWFRENYSKCLYIDVGMQIYKPIDKILNLDCTNKLLAHSDAYPTYQRKLHTQFDSKVFPELYKELSKNYNLNVDYFMSTLMLFDTSIIKDDTFDKLVELSNKYVNATCNEQSIMNLYFMNQWNQIQIKDKKTYYFDWCERYGLNKSSYIMLKYPKGSIREL